MREVKRNRKRLQNIIKKYNIDTESKTEHKKGERTCIRAGKDYNCYQKFKMNKFFDEDYISAKEKKAMESDKITNQVIDSI